MRKDVVWLDYARFLGIFLVIYAHSLQRIPGWISCAGIKSLWDYIYLFHMPLFFIISGYLYKQDGGETLKIRLGWVGLIWHKLIVPYLLYQLIYLPLCLIHYREELLNSELWLRIFIGFIAGDGYTTPFSIVICLPCWFIISIIQLRLLFMLVPINKVTSVILSVLSITILVVMNHCNIDMYFCLDSTLMAIPYFLAGHYIGRTNVLKRICNKRLQVSIMILTGIVVYGIMITNGVSQMNGPTYGNSIFFNYLAGFSGSMMVFMMSMTIANYLKAKDEVKKISRHTLFLIFSHWLLLYPICLILKKVFAMTGIGNTIEVLLAAIISTIVILLVSCKMIDYGSDRIPALFGKQ